MGTPYIGEIRLFAGSFAPLGYAACDGQIVPIAENEALFTLIGTTYGGDGQAVFQLPDLRGRIPLHFSGARPIGIVGGSETASLTAAHLPPHAHGLNAGAGGTKESSPANAVFASGGVQQFASNRVAPLSGMLLGGLAPGGGNQPHDNMMPFATLTFIISLFGIFPSPT